MGDNIEKFKLHNKFYDNVEEILTEIEFVKKGKNSYISNIPNVFDIESSSFYKDNEKCGCMYAWVFGINGKCIRGRTWEEFLQVVDKLKEYYELNIVKRLVVYVHNLSFEFQWIRHLFKWYKVFNVEERKPIYAITTSGIEFRCSYILSGLSLAKVGENLMKYKVSKMVGDLDYRLIRHKSTPLNDVEWGYILNDGLVVMAFIQEEIERCNGIKNIPLTKTGYVRNDCRDKCLKGNGRINYSRQIKSLTLTTELFQQCLRAFCGGWTHGNNEKIGMNEKLVGSFDLTSSYPTTMLSEMYPMSPPQRVFIKDKKDFEKKINCYCCLFDIKFYGLKSKFKYEHYISVSKCKHLSSNHITDNGRIVSADELVLSITEIDFKIISEIYEWDSFQVANFNIFRKGYLPKPIIECILQYYVDKTQLKGVEGKEQEYLVAKGLLNAIYGMMVTNPCKDDIIYDDINEWYIEPKNIDDLIDIYNKSRTRFLYYPWGIWVTAYARFNLWTAIRECKSDYIYCDTDSVKICNYEKHLKYFNEYNNNIINKVKKCLCYYDLDTELAEPKNKKGEKQPIGVWTFEGVYEMFKTLGAKRYIYVQNDKLHITISGVRKSDGINYLMYKYKTFDNIFEHFDNNLVFPSTYINDNNEICLGCGKLTHTYIDIYQSGYVKDYLGNEDTFCEYSSMHLEESSYCLSMNNDFLDYLRGVNSSYIQKRTY